MRIAPWDPTPQRRLHAGHVLADLTVHGLTCAIWVERAPQLIHEGLTLGDVGEGGVVVGVGADAGGGE